MKSKKPEKAPSRFTRGVKVGAKRRHGRKPDATTLVREEATRKLDVLTPL